jgi:peptide/nickel transport system substrate-binding protein
MELPYWSQEFVGNGPYRLREWVLGSHLVVEANDRFARGRPKIDVVEVRFITDSAGLIGSILAGAVDLTLGTTGLSLEQAVDVRDRWSDGHVETAPANLRRLNPQHMNPSPAIIGNADFRRAMLLAIDRQELIDTLEGGLTAVPVSFMPPGQPAYRELEATLPRYDFDPRRAAQILEGLGYRKAANGMYAGEAGPLGVELKTVAGDDNQNKIMFSIADYWERFGVDVDPILFPAQSSDRQALAQHPGFYLSGGKSGLSGLENLHTLQAPTAENNWTGASLSRYSNPQYDALYERYLVTVPVAPRSQVLGQILTHIATELPVLPVYYRVAPTLIANRVQGPGPVQLEGAQVWNVHEWDTRTR